MGAPWSEILNRAGEIVVFRPLTGAGILAIVESEDAEVGQRLVDRQIPARGNPGRCALGSPVEASTRGSVRSRSNA